MYIASLGKSIPRRGGAASRVFGRSVLQLVRWKVEGEIPDIPKMVIIGAPHTTNWDFVVGMATLLALGADIRWIGKHTIFRKPFSGFMKWLGGTPINRSSPQGVVTQVVKEFTKRDQFILALAPEGTRREGVKWKTGFYNIAVHANVPILLTRFDTPRRTFSLLPLFHPSGDVAVDLPKILATYEGFRGKRGHSFLRRLVPFMIFFCLSLFG